jgi:hypothetical protein
VREAFFDWLDPELWDRLIDLFTNYYRASQQMFAGVFLRSQTLTECASAALGYDRMVDKHYS